jgi:hypothetical protein
MRFADPQACPECSGAIAGDPRCPSCGLDLTSTEIRQLWQLLLQADALVARAPHVNPAVGAAPAGAAGAPAPAPDPSSAPPPPSFPAEPTPLPFPRGKERRWSVGTILLVLGAFGLIVAGLIFVTRSWADLGLVGRTVILSGVTAIIGALGVWVTRRPLRASAEAVWTIFSALLTLDFFAARHEGMLGLGDLQPGWACVVWGAVLLALGCGIVHLAREHVGTDLVAPAVVAGLGIALSGIGAAFAPDGWEVFWRAFLGLVVTGVLGLAARPSNVRIVTLAARFVVGVFYLFAFVTAAVELIDHPALDDLVSDRHGLPLALMAVASVAVAAVVRPLRPPAVALSVLALAGLVIAPSTEGWWPEGAWLSVAVLAVALAVAAARGTSDWIRGIRLGTVPVVGALGILLLAWLAQSIGTMAMAVDDAWSASWDARPTLDGLPDTTTWPVFVVVAAALVAVAFLLRWPEAAALVPHARSTLLILAAVGLLDAVVAGRLPVWLAVTALLVAAVALVIPRNWWRTDLCAPTSAALATAAALLAAFSQEVSTGAWLTAAVVLAVLALMEGPLLLRLTYAAGATVLLLSGVASGIELAGTSDPVIAFVVLGVALALLTAAGSVLRGHPVRPAVESAAALGVFADLVAGGSTAELAARWTIAGVVIIALSLAVTDRRWYLWPGVAALVVAYILLIVDSGFSFVEAYTLPLGAGALGFGTFLVRRHPSQGTWPLLGPGLALSLLPSVPQALAEPTGLRALLLGIAALVVLAAGIRLGWQAPFVSGVTIATLLVLFNIGPYANAAPRVVLIAGVSAILLGVGITWEDRARDSRLLVKYVRSMR